MGGVIVIASCIHQQMLGLLLAAIFIFYPPGYISLYYRWLSFKSNSGTQLLIDTEHNIFSKTSKMKQSRYFIAAILLLVAFMCIVCNSCTNSYNLDKTKEFVNKHGEDDFSIFYGVNPMFYRGRQDSLYLLGGIIPRQQGEIDSWAATGIYYNINDCTIVKIRRSREGWTDSTYASIDSTYINNLTRRFVELDIYEIYMNTDGTIRIQIDEHPQSCVVRFDNDSIMKIYSKDCKWNCISANWYIPQ